jgi:fumarate reductase subunit C
MNYLKQETGIIHRLNQRNYLIYFLRELSAIPIIIYCVAYLFCTQISHSSVPLFISYLGLFGAAFHTLTWFRAMAKLMPLSHHKAGMLINYLLLIIAFAAMNYIGFQILL